MVAVQAVHKVPPLDRWLFAGASLGTVVPITVFVLFRSLLFISYYGASAQTIGAVGIVLSWYNTLSAMAYKPFLDRLTLDKVENIPTYVEQTATFVIAVSTNLFQSYWCAVELCKAVECHAQGTLNILLVPVQGEVWREPGSGRTLSFPTPRTVLERFDAWFPELPGATRAAIERARDDGDLLRQSTAVSNMGSLMDALAAERDDIAAGVPTGGTLDAEAYVLVAQRQGACAIAVQDATVAVDEARAAYEQHILANPTRYAQKYGPPKMITGDERLTLRAQGAARQARYKEQGPVRVEDTAWLRDEGVLDITLTKRAGTWWPGLTR